MAPFVTLTPGRMRAIVKKARSMSSHNNSHGGGDGSEVSLTSGVRPHLAHTAAPQFKRYRHPSTRANLIPLAFCEHLTAEY